MVVGAKRKEGRESSPDRSFCLVFFFFKGEKFPQLITWRRLSKFCVALCLESDAGII
jgi:hypothetical protein